MKNNILLGISISLLLCCTLPAAASGTSLGVFGNANEDGTIDLQDVEYTERIILGFNDQNQLADAKYDDKVDILDVTQIELIILGKENELTILQYLEKPEYHEEPVTVPMPIERIVVLAGSYGPETFCAFGEQDKIVGVGGAAKKRGELRTFVENIPSVGGYTKWDMEKIIELKPDIVVAYAHMSYSDYETMLNAAGIPLVRMDFSYPKKYSREIRNLGWILHRQEKAEELINFEQQYLDLIEKRVEGLEDAQKPRVYFESYAEHTTCGPGSGDDDCIRACGGINIFADATMTTLDVDSEAVIERNPQVILKKMWVGSVPSGYDVTDTGPMEVLSNDIMSRSGYDHLNAVKNGRVYLISTDTKSTHSCVYCSYIARWLHPELFEDLDPEAIHAEWLEKFLGIEYNGVYAYPLLEES